MATEGCDAVMFVIAIAIAIRYNQADVPWIPWIIRTRSGSGSNPSKWISRQLVSWWWVVRVVMFFLFCLIHLIPGGSQKMTGVGSALLHLRRWDELQAKMKAEKEVPSSGGSVYIIQKDIWLHVAMAHHAQAMISKYFKWMVVKSEMRPKFQDLKPKISHQWEGPTKACRGGCGLMLLMIKLD